MVGTMAVMSNYEVVIVIFMLLNNPLSYKKNTSQFFALFFRRRVIITDRWTLFSFDSLGSSSQVNRLSCSADSRAKVLFIKVLIFFKV